MQKSTNNQEEKISIVFNRANQQDENTLAELEKSLSFINSLPYGKSFSPGELLKFFFKKPSEKEMIKLQKSRMTNEQKIDFWIMAYNKLNGTTLTKDEFIVNVLPVIGEKNLKKLEKRREENNEIV